MNLVNRTRRLAVLAGALALFAAAQPASAQEVADSHLAAARSAISALRATDEFDGILPQAAQALKTELIQNNPDLQADVSSTVDRVALSLASRRADLEREAALAYARVFSEEELRQMAEFYASDAGKKLLADGPIVMREVYRAAEIWQNGIARDLAVQVAQDLGVAASATRGGAAQTEGEGEGEEAPAGEDPADE